MYNEDRCYDFVCRLINACFEEPQNPRDSKIDIKEYNKLVYRQKLIFIETVGLELWCDVANLDCKKVKKEMRKKINIKLKEIL